MRDTAVQNCHDVGNRYLPPADQRSAVSSTQSGTTEGTAVDPDLDPNLQHWQDRFDSLQWVIGSLSGLLDSIPT